MNAVNAALIFFRALLNMKLNAEFQINECLNSHLLFLECRDDCNQVKCFYIRDVLIIFAFIRECNAYNYLL